MPKILVVDDDPGALDLLSFALQNAGYDVIVADHGEEALQKAANQTPDLIILDVMMPEIDGYEVCRRLRKRSLTRRVPIIMLTAKSFIEDKVEGFEAGADDYVTKPVVPAELLARVKAQLARSQASSQPRGHFIGLLGAKGGTGVTTLAVNASLALQEQKRPTILVDFAPCNPATMLQLGLRQSTALRELFTQDTDAISSEVVAQHLVSHSSGLRVLPPLQETSARYRGLATTQADSLLKSLQYLAAYVVVDFGSSVDEAAEAALQHCHRVALVIEPDRLALQLAERRTSHLKEICVRDDWLGVVVVERGHSADPLSRAQIEDYLGLEVWRVIATAEELARQAVDQAMPVLMTRPQSAMAMQIRQFAAQVS